MKQIQTMIHKYKSKGGIALVPIGNVVQDFKIGNTRIRICDDSLLSEEESEKALDRISEMVSDVFRAMPDEKIIEINERYEQRKKQKIK